MENAIRTYQKDIIEAISRAIKNEQKEIIIQMSIGTGKSTVIKKLLEHLELVSTTLLITSTRLSAELWEERINEQKNIKICPYTDELLNNHEEKYIIVENSEDISNQKYQYLQELFSGSTFIFFCSTIPKKNSWINEKKIDYSYTLKENIEEGYLNPKFISKRNFEHLIFKLLVLSDYTIEIEPRIEYKNGIFRPDFIIAKGKNKKIIEVKEYKSEFISNTILNGAVRQIKTYQKAWQDANKEAIQPILIVSCQVSDELKESYYQESRVLIIDISNLLYLLQDNDEMMKLLTTCVHYNIYPVPPKNILDILALPIEEKKIEESIHQNLEAFELIERLETMPYGRNDNVDKKYEKLCVDIVNYLFKTEFTRMLEQHSTEDQMFRMDLICGLKGASKFWNILIKHYDTRFVVFEFKNYEEKISQNLIYITEKYLHHATLRNVAIIISRKGFSTNAHQAANGILTKDGKLVIDISDEDIITMLRMKADEEDASDYMLDKLEQWLMSISK